MHTPHPSNEDKPMKNLLTKAPALLLLALFCVSATGCNTVEGAGKDVKKAGEEIEEAADEAKN